MVTYPCSSSVDCQLAETFEPSDSGHIIESSYAVDDSILFFNPAVVGDAQQNVKSSSISNPL